MLHRREGSRACQPMPARNKVRQQLTDEALVVRPGKAILPAARGRGPRIADVAREAGVSISTVSRVVRGHDDVHDGTRTEVQRVIERLGYRPSILARALVSGYSRTIALIVSDLTNPFYPQLARSVEEEAKASGFAVVVCNTDDDPIETVGYIGQLLDHGVAGVIHASVGRDEDQVLAVLGDARRIVFANRRPLSRAVSYVVSDNRRAGRMLGEHLIGLGHRVIGFIAGPSWAANSQERLAGLEEAARAGGAELLTAEGDFAARSAPPALDAWLPLRAAPSAVVGVNDQVALGILAELIDRGYRVPGDIAVAGFDDIDLAASRVIGLTTVAQHIRELGSRSVQILLRQLPAKTFRVQRVELQPDLIVRQTTDPSRGAGVASWREPVLADPSERPRMLPAIPG